jgi:hypothetical protein
MILNAEYNFDDVRYLISSKVAERMRLRHSDGKTPFRETPPGHTAHRL